MNRVARTLALTSAIALVIAAWTHGAVSTVAFAATVACGIGAWITAGRANRPIQPTGPQVPLGPGPYDPAQVPLAYEPLAYEPPTGTADEIPFAVRVDEENQP